MVPKQRVNAKENHLTLLGVILLKCDPVLCVVIFGGTREIQSWETGNDIFAKYINLFVPGQAWCPVSLTREL